MLKVEKIDVWGFEHAIRGMRNPMNSWNKSDSGYPCIPVVGDDIPDFEIGEKDLELMRKLYRAGTEHRKYLRQIFVSMDITAPLYWWKEMDTYKIGTVANSCSTMHRIMSKPFEMSDFSFEKVLVSEDVIENMEKTLQQNLAVDTIKRMNIPAMLAKLQQNAIDFEESVNM